MRWLLRATLIISLLAPVAAAQAPLPRTQIWGSPYDVLSYDYSDYSVNLTNDRSVQIPAEKENHWISIVNDGLVGQDDRSVARSEVWVQNGGKTVYHGQLIALAEGGVFRITDNATSHVVLDGKGRFLLVRPDLAYAYGALTDSINTTMTTRAGFVVPVQPGATGDPRVCLMSEFPLDVEVLSSGLARLDSVQNVPRFREAYNEHAYLHVILTPSKPGWVNLTRAYTECESLAVPPAVVDPRPDGETAGTGSVVVVAVLVVTALLRGSCRRFR